MALNPYEILLLNWHFSYTIITLDTNVRVQMNFRVEQQDQEH